MKLFVPGRLCLFGEHSDWAGGYRTVNPNLGVGYTIIVGTNQGLYADVTRLDNPNLIMAVSLDDGTQKFCRLMMQPEILLQAAQAGDFFSYAVGVAYQIQKRFGQKKFAVGGLEINNYHTDLPVKKGLSSSAAICVLVARAFNLAYDLQLSVREEMEFAYLGEITTGSLCGRMDQGCAFGNVPIGMEFDGLGLHIDELEVGKDLYFVVVDLAASKDTKKILADLNACYPVAQSQIHRDVQDYLGRISYGITQNAIALLKSGDGKALGELMRYAQSECDRCLIPVSMELTAPVLHNLLNYQPLQPYIWGGKGVGSQGDGTAQFIVKSEVAQGQVMDIIKRDFPRMQPLQLTIYARQESRS